MARSVEHSPAQSSVDGARRPSRSARMVLAAATAVCTALGVVAAPVAFAAEAVGPDRQSAGAITKLRQTVTTQASSDTRARCKVRSLRKAGCEQTVAPIEPAPMSPSPAPTLNPSLPTTSTGACAVKPDATNTGVRAGTVLTPDSRADLRTAGEVVAGREFRPAGGVLRIYADGVSLVNTKVWGAVVVYSQGVTLENVTAYGVGLSGARDAVVRRADLHGFSGRADQPDAIHVTSDSGRARNILLEGNYIHDPRPAADAHFDGTQVRGVDGLTIRCSTYDLGAFQPQLNATIFFEDVQGGNVNVTISDNWLDGGGYTVRLHATDLVVTGNRFGTSHMWGLCTRGSSLVGTGNVEVATDRTVDLLTECVRT